jgi:hypothetical protein
LRKVVKFLGSFFNSRENKKVLEQENPNWKAKSKYDLSNLCKNKFRKVKFGFFSFDRAFHLF